MSKKRNFWNITAKVTQRFEVQFDIPVTKEEAMWQFECEDDNIIDSIEEEILDIHEIIKVEEEWSQ